MSGVEQPIALTSTPCDCLAPDRWNDEIRAMGLANKPLQPISRERPGG
jgi:hypothetical protein